MAFSAGSVRQLPSLSEALGAAPLSPPPGSGNAVTAPDRPGDARHRLEKMEPIHDR